MKNNESLNRIRLLRIWEILNRETDEDHPMGTETLREKLLEGGIGCHRVTLYEDIKLLNEAGYEIMTRRGRSNQYYVMDRKFSNPEVHILMDAVQAASFITEKKTAELVDKIAHLAGSQKAAVLKKNIVQFNTAKSDNESIYYSVSEIVTAINNRQKILFRYFDYDSNHERVYRRDGHRYAVSPFATIFSDGHYYLVIYDDRHNKMVHYRIDRMENVTLLNELAVMPPDEMAFDVGSYKKQLFGMFSGEATNVTIEMSSHLMDVVFDLFGEKTKILPFGDDKIRFSADVQISDLFFGWCSSFEKNVKLIAPQNVLEDYKAYLAKIQLQYQEGANDEENK